ncbi:MAG: efflux RND transporter permease subunit [Spirochaetales bacterium]|nr:efflux RND transporter permease subunit [Spirochaetales bacterium]
MLKKLLKKPLTVVVSFLVVSLLGLSLLKDIPLDFFPSFEVPIIAISTTYPMATPGEVEESVTRVIEENIVDISGLKEVTSSSRENYSLIIMEFDWGETVVEKSNDVRDKLERISSQLPEECEKPIVLKYDPNSQPVMELTLNGSRDISELYEIAETDIALDLERLPGVASVEIGGGTKEIVKVEFLLNRMEALNISISQVASILKSQNVKLGSGSITEGDLNYLIKTQGDFTSIEEIKNTAIRTIPDTNGNSGYEILLKDIADISVGYKDLDSRIFINGDPGITISIVKRTEANAVKTAEEVTEVIKKINKDLPGDLEIKILSDSSTEIKNSLSEVLSSAWLGLVFAVLILLIFLRQIRSTIIVAISLPVSLLITIAGISLTGNTINMLTLTGLLVGIGMIVDGSIVMLENIFAYRNKGVLLEPSAYLGASEMASPITGSTLTSIFVFLPLLLFGKQLDIFGILFSSMSLTVIIALVSSLVVAIFLIPVLSGKIIKIYTSKQRPIKNPILKVVDSGIENSLLFLEKTYKVSLELLIKHKIKTILILVLLLILSALQIKNLGFIMMPQGEAVSVNMNIELPVGSSLDTTERVVKDFQTMLENEAPDIENIITTIGTGQGAVKTSFKASMLIILADKDNRVTSENDVKNILRSNFSKYPGSNFEFVNTDQASKVTGGSGLNINITGSNLEKVEETALKLESLIKDKSQSVTDISSDFDGGLPQIVIEFDRAKVYDLGLNTATVAEEIKAMIAGITAGTYYNGTDEMSIVLRLKEKDRDKRINLDSLFILNKNGTRIPLSSIATLKEDDSPATINRLNQSRIITLNCTPAIGVKSNVLKKEIEEIIEDTMLIPDGVNIELSGDMEQLKEYGQALIMIIGFALLLVFAVMVSQFESIKAPFIIFLSMPMLLIGIVLAFTLMSMPLSMFSFIGILMLSGIVVNNGIVLVDRINLYVKRGMEIREASIEASISRLRPILMTTLTTVCAMIPMAYFPGEGGELIQPLGVTVTAGLVGNTIITLYFVPILYNLIMKKKESKDE